MSSKLSTKERNDRRWETHKHHIRNVYMEKDHTLKQTMKIVQETHRFKARSVPTHLYHDFLFGINSQTSERKWKDKLKEWKFEKNISATDMKVLVAKCGKRKRDEGKDTTFFHLGMEIPSEKLENFKKRKSTKTMEVVSPIAGMWYIALNRVRTFLTARQEPLQTLPIALQALKPHFLPWISKPIQHWTKKLLISSASIIQLSLRLSGPENLALRAHFVSPSKSVKGRVQHSFRPLPINLENAVCLLIIFRRIQSCGIALDEHFTL